MTNPINATPYLRTTRDFPEDMGEMSAEINKAYLEIAAATNNRTIGIYSLNKPSINGNSFYIQSKRQQGLRQIYTFTATTDIPCFASFCRILTLAIWGNYRFQDFPISERQRTNIITCFVKIEMGRYIWDL